MLAIFYGVFTLLIVLTEFIRQKRFFIDFLTFFNFSFIIYYTLPSFLLSLNFEKAAHNETKLAISDFQDFETAIAMVVGYTILVIGYYYKLSSSRKINVELKRRIPIKYDFIFLFGLIALTVFSIIIYSAQYGGVLNAINLSSFVRSGYVEPTSLSFFKRFFSAAKFVSFLIFAYILFEDSLSNKRKKYFPFFVSIILTLFGFLFLASRGVYIEYILIFILIFIIRKRKISISKFLPVFVIGIFILLYGDLLFANIGQLITQPSLFTETFFNSINSQGKNLVDSFYSLMANFQFSAVSLNVSLDVIRLPEYSFRFFLDIIYGFLSLFPEVLIGIKIPETIAFYNTYYIKGEFISNIPPGIIGFSIYSLGWPGLIIFMFIWGWFGGLLEKIFSYNIKNHYWVAPLYFLFALDWSTASSGEPRLYFQSKFILLVIFVYFYFIASHRIRKRV